MKIKNNIEVKASDYYDVADPRGMSTREFDDYMRAKNGNNNTKKVIMTQEQKEYLKQLINISNFDPFQNDEFEKKHLTELRNKALKAIKEYKEYNKKIKDKKYQEDKINELIKAIDSIQSSE
jgi:ribonuclease I